MNKLHLLHEAEKLYCDENLSPEIIAEKLNISRRTVFNWKKKYKCDNHILRIKDFSKQFAGDIYNVGVKLLTKLNDDKKCASTSMITFLVLNTSGVTIVPTTILALRKATGSSDPTKVLPLCIMATTASTIGGLTLDYFIRRKNGNK